jgi:diguanylate cyclase (GGDEF)-like protein/PAS domain S-box-containing protein
VSGPEGTRSSPAELLADGLVAGGLADAVLQSSPLPIVVLDTNAIVRLVNQAAERVFGWSAAEVVGQPAPILPAEDAERVQELLVAALSGEPLQGDEVCLLDKWGGRQELEVYTAPMQDEAGAVKAIVVSWFDLGERKQYQAQLAHLATHDELTGLPNRRVFEESLQRGVRRAEKGRHSVLLMVDLDRLKLINDTAGHLAGDRVLAEVAEAMADALRPGDVLARIGGDEFAALVFDVSVEEARLVARRLSHRVAALRIAVHDDVFDPTVSVGVCPIDGSLHPQLVLTRADQALFTAKELGRNRVILADDERLHEFVLGGRWARPIKDALDGQGFLLALQPIVALSDDQPRFHEALIRMRGERDGSVLPGLFLPTAESLGLMPQIDRWVIRNTLRLFPHQPELRVFINLSAAGFEDDALLDQIETHLRGVEPGRVTFEITETGLITNTSRTARRLEALKAFGCRIALDDFGDGFSSFARLRSLPFDFLKIDGSVTRNLDRDAVGRAISRGIVELGHALGLDVIAEQVETEAVADILRELGADYGQGIFWAKPRIVEMPSGRAAHAA